MRLFVLLYCITQLQGSKMKKLIIRDLKHSVAPAGTGGATLHPALIPAAIFIGMIM